ncbi:hypothetical protein K432DRAFT_377355 [Lepidopterella palustris CBS 459.81]|uniref:CFEM domain-containing protein n=1 Tax=Lepidopterella palustris CBS 459.81 TaxID=1314670 RepID=A0A8E2EKF8_9PEZI|nr:hypothetical protein K432DRAFT_377355 [Lepidopterella palustris CBS 459.81]
MKASIALLAVGASLATAQNAQLSACANMCVNNMLGLAPSFGCSNGDFACYCVKPDFRYGIRDCANQACTPAEAVQAISYGDNFCASYLASNSISTTASPPSIPSSTAATANAATASGIASGASSTPVSTIPIVETITASGSTYVVTTGSSTLFTVLGGATESAGSAASSAESSATSVASSANASASSVASSVARSASSAASSVAASAASAASSVAASASNRIASTTGSATAAESSGAPSSSTSGAAAAPMRTTAPLLGAVAMAALFI